MNDKMLRRAHPERKYIARKYIHQIIVYMCMQSFARIPKSQRTKEKNYFFLESIKKGPHHKIPNSSSRLKYDYHMWCLWLATMHEQTVLGVQYKFTSTCTTSSLYLSSQHTVLLQLINCRPQWGPNFRKLCNWKKSNLPSSPINKPINATCC